MRKINIQQPSEFAGKIFINLSHGHHNIPAVLPWVIVSSICSSLNVRRFTSIANITPLRRHDRLPGKRRSKVHTRMLRNAHLLKKTRFDASVSTAFALILCFLCFVFRLLEGKVHVYMCDFWKICVRFLTGYFILISFSRKKCAK